MDYNWHDFIRHFNYTGFELQLYVFHIENKHMDVTELIQYKYRYGNKFWKSSKLILYSDLYFFVIYLKKKMFAKDINKINESNLFVSKFNRIPKCQ